MENPDEGHVVIPSKLKLGYLPQQIIYTDTKNVFDETLTAFSEVLEIENEIKNINNQLENRTDYAILGGRIEVGGFGRTKIELFVEELSDE